MLFAGAMPADAQQWGTLEYGAFGSNNSFTNAVQWAQSAAAGCEWAAV